MKRIFLAASLLIAATTFTGITAVNASTLSTTSKGGGQHIPASQVPAPVMASFNSQFPTATNVQWQKETEHGQTTYQASFNMNGKKWRAVYSSTGTLLSAGPR